MKSGLRTWGHGLCIPLNQTVLLLTFTSLSSSHSKYPMLDLSLISKLFICFFLILLFIFIRLELCILQAGGLWIFICFIHLKLLLFSSLMRIYQPWDHSDCYICTYRNVSSVYFCDPITMINFLQSFISVRTVKLVNKPKCLYSEYVFWDWV